MTSTRTLSVCLVALILTALTLTPGADAGVIKDCYNDWSRCSRWSSPLTGILWKNCDKRCKQLGKRSGKCVRVRARCPVSKTVLQCQCS
ncbi:unnamed protein product [Candidula unifasciata]|uniref:Uncharacterized protein n=1 Tax=Candidula unifasciata TaxID=100452 RepID=A0A8S4A4X8_9EUPU|nr:unnamed protein product [Candidula unifasciata]